MKKVYLLDSNGDRTKESAARLKEIGKDACALFGGKYSNQCKEDAKGFIFFGNERGEVFTTLVTWKELMQDYNFFLMCW